MGKTFENNETGFSEQDDSWETDNTSGFDQTAASRISKHSLTEEGLADSMASISRTEESGWTNSLNRRLNVLAGGTYDKTTLTILVLICVFSVLILLFGVVYNLFL